MFCSTCGIKIELEDKLINKPGCLNCRGVSPLGPCNYHAQLSRYAKALIDHAISESGGNTSIAAEQLGMSRTTLVYNLKRFGVEFDKVPSKRGKRKEESSSGHD